MPIGGDSIPIVTPFRLFGAENHLSLSALPSLPPIASIPHDRILASWWDREINLCKVSTDLFEINDIELTPNGEPNAGVFAKILIQVSGLCPFQTSFFDSVIRERKPSHLQRCQLVVRTDSR